MLAMVKLLVTHFWHGLINKSDQNGIGIVSTDKT